MIDGILNFVVDLQNVLSVYKGGKFGEGEILCLGFHENEVLCLVVQQEGLPEKVKAVQEKLLLGFPSGGCNGLAPGDQVVDG